MTVFTYITNDINTKGLYTDVWGHKVTPVAQNFDTGDVIKFEVLRGYNMSFNGWFVFDANDEQFHLDRLPIYLNKGFQSTPSVELIMNYTSSVIVVAEMT